jgi:hypothetical protein
VTNDRNNLQDEELEAIRQRCENAAPGPWRSFVEGRDHSSHGPAAIEDNIRKFRDIVDNYRKG